MSNKNKGKKQSNIQRQNKIIIEIYNSYFKEVNYTYTVDSELEAKAMVYGFNTAFDICSNDDMSARIKKQII